MDIAIVVFILTAIILSGGIALVFKQRKTNVHDAEPQRERPARPLGRGRRAARRRRRARNNENDSEEELYSEEEDDEGLAEVEPEQELGGRSQRVKAYEERRRQREEEREAREQQEAEERLRKAEERRKQDEEEAQKWAEFITVEEKGEVEETTEEDLLEQFVSTIQSRKIVVLEELAAEFGIRTQEVIQRIHDLEANSRITGVMDDRGKYLYIPLSEMVKVREYIESRGRVSIVELAMVSHRLVDIDGYR